MNILKSIPGISESYSTQILEVFSDLPKSGSLILFGSRAKGSFRDGSDIDLAVKCNEVTLEYRDRWLERYYSLNLPWKIDLVIYHLISEPELQKHIDRVGKSFFLPVTNVRAF